MKQLLLLCLLSFTFYAQAQDDCGGDTVYTATPSATIKRQLLRVGEINELKFTYLTHKIAFLENKLRMLELMDSIIWFNEHFKTVGNNLFVTQDPASQTSLSGFLRAHKNVIRMYEHEFALRAKAIDSLSVYVNQSKLSVQFAYVHLFSELTGCQRWPHEGQILFIEELETRQVIYCFYLENIKEYFE